MLRFLLILLFPCFCFGQTELPVRKNQYGFTFAVMQHQVGKKTNYSALNTNAAVDVGFWYRKKFATDTSSYLFLQTGVDVTRRFSDRQNDSIEVRIDERFYELPLYVGITILKSKHFGFSFGVGTSAGVLKKQSFYTPVGNGATSPYGKEGGFGDYVRLAVLADIGMNFSIGKRTIALVGLRGTNDFNSPVFKPNGNTEVFSYYRSFGLYFGFGKAF